jgi:hypothetical protein
VLGEALGFFGGDVAGEDESGVCGAVVIGVEAGDVVARESTNTVEGADGGLAVGLVAVEEAWADAAGGCDDGVTLLRDADEALFTDAFKVVGVEGGVLDDVGEKSEWRRRRPWLRLWPCVRRCSRCLRRVGLRCGF